MDPFIGEIRLFTWDYAPAEWLDCNGQFLSIREFSPLFAVIGYIYGKKGEDFALPNLSGRAPLGAVTESNPPDLSRVPIGTTSGSTTVQLHATAIPGHNHRVTTFNNGDRTKLTGTPSPNAYIGRYLLETPPSIVESFRPGTEPQNRTFSSGAIAAAGESQPHENMQPYLALRFCIAFRGIYPARS